jgi:hypothetical protein
MMAALIAVRYDLEIHGTNFIYNEAGTDQFTIYPGMSKAFFDALVELIPDDVIAFYKISECIDPHLIKKMNEFKYWFGAIERESFRGPVRVPTIYRSFSY